MLLGESIKRDMTEDGDWVRMGTDGVDSLTLSSASSDHCTTESSLEGTYEGLVADGWDVASAAVVGKKRLVRSLRKQGILGEGETITAVVAVDHSMESSVLLSMATQLLMEGTANRPLDLELLLWCINVAGIQGIEPEVNVMTMYKPASRKIRPIGTPLPGGIAPTSWGGELEEEVLRRRREGMTEDRIDILCSEAGWLQPEKLVALKSMLREESEAFSFNLADRGRVKVDVCDPVKVHTVPHSPWKYRPRKVPYAQLEKLVSFLKEKLEAGIMEPCFGSYAANFFVVPKKDGGIRMIQDLQPLNAVTIRDAGVPPRVEGIVNSYSGLYMVSPLDCHSFYDQFILDVESRDLTAIATPLGLMRMVTLPMGWTNSVPVAQRGSVKILQPFIPEDVEPYLDDYVVKGPKAEDADHSEVFPGIRLFAQHHLDVLRGILRRIRASGVTLSGLKSRFFAEACEVLGHWVSRLGRQPSPSKAVKLAKWGNLNSVQEVRAFLGLATFFRRYIPHFALRADSLYKMLRKGAKFTAENWELVQEAKTDLAESLAVQPVLRPIDYSDGAGVIYLAVDASPLGWGAWVGQEGREGGRGAVSFFSGRFNDTERLYDQPKREVLGTLRGLKAAHQYVWGANFVLETDAKALLGSLAHIETLDATQQRWLLAIRSYHATVRHVSGKANVVADTLSRHNLEPGSSDNGDEVEEHVDRVLGLKLVHQRAISAMSWNVNSTRNAAKKMEGFSALILAHDVIFLQETRQGRCSFTSIKGFDFTSSHDAYWIDFPVRGGVGWGRNGVAVLVKKNLFEGEGIPRVCFDGWSVEEMEGRYLEVRFGRIVLVSAYFPAAGRGRDHRIPYKMAFSRAALARFDDLEGQGCTLLMGCDWNVSETPLDVHRSALDLINSGFRDEEREWLSGLCSRFTDTFRHLHPGKVSYTTWWHNDRRGNVGFRFDGVMVSKSVQVLSAVHLEEVWASDHIPVVASVVMRDETAVFGGVNEVDKPEEGVQDAMLMEGLDVGTRLGQVFWFLWTGSAPPNVTGQSRARVKRQASLCFISDKKLFRHSSRHGGNPLRVVASVEWQQEIVRQAHEGFGGGHRSVFGTGQKIQRRYFWRNMWDNVREFIRTCDACQRQNPVRYMEKLEEQEGRLTTLFGTWHVDLVTMEGAKRYLALFIDEVSGWVEGVVLTRKMAIPIVRAMEREVFARFGVPQLIVIDGGELDGVALREAASRMGYDVEVTMAYGQQANGLVERVNVPIVSALAKACEGRHQSYHLHLHAALWASRITVRRTTMYSPYELCFGQEPVLPIEFVLESFAIIQWRRMSTEELLAARIRMLQRRDYDIATAKRKIQEARQKRALLFNKEHRIRPPSEQIEEGDLVVVRDSALDQQIGRKLRWRYYGPFWVREKGLNAYWLAEMDGAHISKAVQGSRVRLYRKREDEEGVFPLELLEEEEDERDGEVAVDYIGLSLW